LVNALWLLEVKLRDSIINNANTVDGSKFWVFKCFQSVKTGVEELEL